MWKEIAKKLGVELDELFDIVNIEGQIIAKNVYEKCRDMLNNL